MRFRRRQRTAPAGDELLVRLSLVETDRLGTVPVMYPGSSASFSDEEKEYADRWFAAVHDQEKRRPAVVAELQRIRDDHLRARSSIG